MDSTPTEAETRDHSHLQEVGVSRLDKRTNVDFYHPRSQTSFLLHKSLEYLQMQKLISLLFYQANPS
ncbi:hypothetical protein Desaci_3056 [Desulfosporosinus acidiphilus SJ4]|uniref:Uncharacterized protein n=1 Tax=Desulfosporosinus acidiphilus (strain DSM 22704 / JCM 16185 / SJ4) TaxID=646529 RepID=I4D839_DESAJ|nr:hypothetical protein Desaci_3056 [Desulfosporosinus acidiphilus SJ4]